MTDYITGPTELIAKYFKDNYQNKFLSKILKNQDSKIFPSPIVPPKEEEQIKLDIINIGKDKWFIYYMVI